MYSLVFILYIVCFCVHIFLYTGLFFFNEYYVVLNGIYNGINTVILIFFTISVFGLIRAGIEKPAMLQTTNKHYEFKRLFPNTDITKTKRALNITNAYFITGILFILLTGMIKKHPDSLPKIALELLQEDSPKSEYLKRILASTWWFLFLLIPLIYFNEKRQKRKTN